MELTEQERETAEATIGKWFWQPVEGKFFRYKYAVKTFVRYYECAPVAADTLRILIEYLRTQEIPSDGKISLLNKQVGGFEGWKAKEAWYQTSTDQWEGTKSDKVRIYQAFYSTPEDAGTGDGPYVVENGCQYQISHTFYWNVETPPQLPASSSGINYSIQGLIRDSETGLFSCLIEKRERKVQTIELYDNIKTAFETRQIAQYLGVKADDVESTGLQASVNNGQIAERRLSKNPDCTTDIENVVTTEESVDDAVVEIRKTLRGKVKTKLDRNQPAPLTDESMAIGETRRSEKTPGKRFNNTTVETTREAAGKIAEACTKTIFEHEHQIVENVVSEPSVASVAEASEGIIHSRTVRKTDENTYDITDTSRTEESVDDAVVEIRRTLRGKVKTKLDRNQPAPLTEESMAIGETRRSEKTPGKRWNNTTTQLIQVIAGKIAAACVKVGGGTMHQHQSVEVVESEPASSASSAAVNYQHQRAIHKTEEGWQVTNTTTQWNPYSESESWADEFNTYKQKVYVNSLTPQKPPAGIYDHVMLSFHPNGHGSFDGSWITRVGHAVTPGETLQWSIGPEAIETDYYYFRKDGELCKRKFMGYKYVCGGKLPHVSNQIARAEKDGFTIGGKTIKFGGNRQIGWGNSVSGSYRNAMGEAYAVTEVGTEEKVDKEESEA